MIPSPYFNNHCPAGRRRRALTAVPVPGPLRIHAAAALLEQPPLHLWKRRHSPSRGDCQPFQTRTAAGRSTTESHITLLAHASLRGGGWLAPRPHSPPAGTLSVPAGAALRPIMMIQVPVGSRWQTERSWTAPPAGREAGCNLNSLRRRLPSASWRPCSQQFRCPEPLMRTALARPLEYQSSIFTEKLFSQLSFPFRAVLPLNVVQRAAPQVNKSLLLSWRLLNPRCHGARKRISCI
jgi:hypothetical protein